MKCFGISSLPVEILVDILTRLPAKVVGQCKCICKHWLSLLEDPSFVVMHRDRAKSRSDGCCLVISFMDCDYSKLHFFSADYRGGPAQHLLTHLMPSEPEVQQSVNGLICGFFFFFSLKSIFILNPTTKEIVTLPPSGYKPLPPSNYKTRTYCSLLPFVSFGFDPSTNQYKVLIIYTVQLLQSFCEKQVECIVDQCEIFTLGTHSWRKIDAVPPVPKFVDGSCCVNGVLYWIKMRDGVLDDFIVAFELKEERFGVISFPNGPSHMCQLLELGDHLVACEDLDALDGGHLWILQDYDNWIWVKESLRPPLDWVQEDDDLFTMGAIQTGEIFLMPILSSVSPLLVLFYYNRDQKSFRKVQITGLPSSEFLCRSFCGEVSVSNNVENLLSLRDI